MIVHSTEGRERESIRLQKNSFKKLPPVVAVAHRVLQRNWKLLKPSRGEKRAALCQKVAAVSILGLLLRIPVCCSPPPPQSCPPPMQSVSVLSPLQQQQATAIKRTDIQRVQTRGPYKSLLQRHGIPGFGDCKERGASKIALPPSFSKGRGRRRPLPPPINHPLYRKAKSNVPEIRGDGGGENSGHPRKTSQYNRDRYG